MHDNAFDFERIAYRVVHDDDLYALIERNTTPITMRFRSARTRISTDLRPVTTERLNALHKPYVRTVSASGTRRL